MKHILFCLSIIIALGAARAPLHTRGDANGVPDAYIVALRPQLTTTRMNVLYKSLSVTISHKLEISGYRGITNTFENVPYNAFHVECDRETLEFIRDNPMVESVYQDGYVYAQHTIPRIELGARDDQSTDETWGLGRISHRDAGNSAYISEVPLQTYLYCLDTGVRLTHKEFGDRAIWGANFVSNSPDTDENGHGTHTCATAAGNTVGVDNTTMPIAVKCLDKNSAGTWSGVMAAIDWAVGDATRRNAIRRSVINMSIGGPTYPPIDDMVSKAVNERKMTIVVAASNANVDASTYSPARAPGAITVAAIDRHDTRASFSNYGESIALFAPGVEIRSAWLNADDEYVGASGTSMAAPHVAGLATYLMSREGLAGPTEVKQRMLELATSGLVQDAKGSPNLIAFNGAGNSFKY